MKKLVFLFAFCVIVGALFACGASDNTGTAASSSSSSSSSSASAAPAHFKVGQAVKVGNWQVTVNSVKTSKGDDISKPQKGQYLLLDVTAKNTSGQEQNISSLADFKLTDPSGISYTETITTLGLPNPPDGKVEAGSPSRGTFVFDVPTSVKNFTFSFAPDITSSGQTDWDITA